MLSLFLSLIVSLTCFASVNQKLANNNLAYYGEDFYKNFPSSKVTKEALSKILNATHISNEGKYDTFSGTCLSQCYSQVSLDYSEARQVIFGKLFTKNDAKGTYVEDVYCGKKFYFRDVHEAMRMNNLVNIEHTWPQSKFTGRFPKDIQKSDLHHLYPTDSEANARRGNFAFGNVAENDDVLGMSDCHSSKLSNGANVTFEPPVNHRGNVARSIFYFATHYNIEIDDAQERAMREWNKQDPVDAAEMARHEIIAGIQKVRNPYVDYPQLVDKISNF